MQFPVVAHICFAPHYLYYGQLYKSVNIFVLSLSTFWPDTRVVDWDQVPNLGVSRQDECAMCKRSNHLRFNNCNCSNKMKTVDSDRLRDFKNMLQLYIICSWLHVFIFYGSLSNCFWLNVFFVVVDFINRNKTINIEIQTNSPKRIIKRPSNIK